MVAHICAHWRTLVDVADEISNATLMGTDDKCLGLSLFFFGMWQMHEGMVLYHERYKG